MGNYWKGISDEDLQTAEIQLLKRAGLTPEEYVIHNTLLGEREDLENYIHSIEIVASTAQRDRLPKLVLLHGYGAGGCYFFRVIKDLSHYFHLYVVDLLGMGASGRPQYAATTYEEAEEFFVSSLKVWKERISLKGKYYLAGHSLGGYISTVYALRYPEEIQELMLLSPVGIPERPDTFSHDEVAARFDSKKDRIAARVILHFWEKGYTPFMPLRLTGFLGAKAFLKFYVGRRMKSITHEEEMSEMKAYMHQIFMRPGCGEYALNTILMPGSWAKSPLIHRLPALQVKVSFFYGQRDWMDPYPAMQLIEEKLLPEGTNLHVIDNSDHHLYFDNPVDMVYKMLKQVFGEGVSEEYKKEKLEQGEAAEEKAEEEAEQDQ